MGDRLSVKIRLVQLTISGDERKSPLMEVSLYGTLRKEGSNHFMIEPYPCIAREIVISGTLHDAKVGYPFLILDGQTKITGEVYELPLSILPQLDDFEDYHPHRDDNVYERIELTVETKEGSLNVMTYVGVKKEMFQTEIEHGDWIKFCEEQDLS